MTALLSSDIWVRWRAVEQGGLVTVLGPGETVRAEGRVADVDPPRLTDPSRSKLSMLAKAVRESIGDWWTSGYDWDFRALGSGEGLFAVRARRSPDDPNVFTVSTDEGSVIGTVSAWVPELNGRKLRSDSGTVCAYLPVLGKRVFWSKPIESRRATIVEGAHVLATVFHDRDTDAVAEVVPKSGLIKAFDFGVAFASQSDAATRLLALVAAILDTKVEVRFSGSNSARRSGRSAAKLHPALGSNRWLAQKQEAAFENGHRYDRTDQLVERARRQGKEEVAEGLEKRRRGG